MNEAGMSPMLTTVGSQDAMMLEQLRNVRIATSKGHKFIQLVHHKPGSIPERVYPVDGILVRIVHNSLTKSNESIVSKQEGKEALFVPDQDTGVRTAYILDTEHNRKFLATHLLENRWSIENPVIEQEIKKLAESIEMVVDTSQMSESASSQPTVRREDIVDDMTEDQLADQIAAKRKEIETLENAKNKKTSTKKQKPVSDEERVEHGELVPNKMKASIPPHVLKKATSIVYQRYASVIDKMKTAHGDQDFIKSTEFKKKILPQLEAELFKAMNEEQGVTETGDENAVNEGTPAGASV